MAAFGAASERERLGRSLGRLRAGVGLSQPQLARQLGWSQAKVSRVEAGKQRVALPDVEAWCQTTGASPERRQEIMALAEQALLGPASWEGVSDHGNLQRATAEMEARAGLVSVYQPAIIPGLLQTAAYARRVFSAGPDGPPADLADRVLHRLERQRILYDDATRLRFVIPETVLRWPVGPADEHREQLARLDEVRMRPSVDLRVLPADPPPSPVWRTSGFVLFDEMAEPDDQGPLVHLETLTRPVDIDEPDQVDAYRRAFERLHAASLAGDDARELICRIRHETA